MSGISVKFRPGKDDDIREWWDNCPDRAYIIRQLIRNWLLNNESEDPSVMFKDAPPMVFDTLEPPKQKLKKVETESENVDLFSQF